MKTFFSILMVLLCVTFLNSCEKSLDEPLSENENTSENLASFRANSSNKILIQSKMSTFHCPTVPEPGCVCQIGSGSSPQLGDFEVFLNFCVIPPFPAGPTDPIHYSLTLGEAYMMADGEQYFLMGGGTVFPVDHPQYDAYFNDEFEFYEDGNGNTISGTLKLNSKVYNINTPEQETKHIVHGFIYPSN